MQTGLDRLFEDSQIDLKNKRIGLLAHQASINNQGKHILDVLLDHPDINLVKLFGPEHGLTTHAQDMEGVESSVDSKTGLPVISLYGNSFDSLKPKRKDFEDIDILICDLQDVGSRYYTYVYTMALCMQTASETNKEVIVLDRPNPINGVDREGPLLREGFESFVGFYAGLPVRHGMTIGELAKYFNAEHNIGCKLHVVTMEGWKREWYFDQTGLPWIKPSPNMVSLDTAILYPGGCLIEATELSEGRGTDHPFEWIGAPFIDSEKLTYALAELKLKGIQFKPVQFCPNFQKWSGKICHGIQLVITDRKKIKPYLVGIAILKTIFDLYPKDFKWRKKPYEFVKNISAIDLLTGNLKVRENMIEKKSLSEMTKDWDKDITHFDSIRKKFLLY